MRENLSLGFCEQHRRRPACASAQSDQLLCCSLSGEQSSQACSIQNATFLASLCSLGDCFESRFVGNPEDRFCRDEAQILINPFTIGRAHYSQLIIHRVLHEDIRIIPCL